MLYTYQWSNEDCYYWALGVASRAPQYIDEATLQTFSLYTGEQLANFGLQDFINISPEHGMLFHTRLQEVKQEEMKQEEMKQEQNNEDHSKFDCFNEGLDLFPDLLLAGNIFGEARTPTRNEEEEESTNLSIPPLPNEFETLLPVQPIGSLGIIDDQNATFQPDASFPDYYSTPFPKYPSSPPYSLDQVSFKQATPPASPSTSYASYPAPVTGYEEEGAWGGIISPDVPHYPITTPHPVKSTRTRDRRPPRKHSQTPPSPPSDDNQASNPLQPLPTRSRNRVRGPSNWEYLMRLLVSDEYNPSLVSWVNRSDWTFKLNNPMEIARMFGNRTRNKTAEGDLNYDNFARGLRYHYTTGALQPVPEHQLMYRCGRKAIEFLQKLTIKTERQQYQHH